MASLRALRRRVRRRLPVRQDVPAGVGSGDTAAVFTTIHDRNAWEGSDSRSGAGSDPAATEALRSELPTLISRLGVDSVLDAPCGDHAWMAEIAPSLGLYVGVDVVEPLVERLRERYGDERRRFLVADIAADPLPRADLVLCRDCLVHMPDAAIRRTLANLKRSGAAWLLATTFVDRLWNARDIELGGWRSLNLEKPPFRLPQPVTVLDERFPGSGGVYADKSLGLWALQSL